MYKCDWDENRIVWDEGHIKYLNNKSPERKGLPKIHIVKRYFEMEMGIRAHPDMNIWKCIKSMFIPLT